MPEISTSIGYKKLKISSLCTGLVPALLYMTMRLSEEHPPVAMKTSYQILYSTGTHPRVVNVHQEHLKQDPKRIHEPEYTLFLYMIIKTGTESGYFGNTRC